MTGTGKSLKPVIFLCKYINERTFRVLRCIEIKDFNNLEILNFNKTVLCFKNIIKFNQNIFSIKLIY